MTVAHIYMLVNESQIANSRINMQPRCHLVFSRQRQLQLGASAGVRDVCGTRLRCPAPQHPPWRPAGPAVPAAQPPGPPESDCAPGAAPPPGWAPRAGGSPAPARHHGLGGSAGEKRGGRKTEEARGEQAQREAARGGRVGSDSTARHAQQHPHSTHSSTHTTTKDGDGSRTCLWGSGRCHTEPCWPPLPGPMTACASATPTRLLPHGGPGQDPTLHCA